MHGVRLERGAALGEEPGQVGGGSSTSVGSKSRTEVGLELEVGLERRRNVPELTRRLPTSLGGDRVSCC